ncbi:MAG TPA: 16S rRNA (guanine(527)-N(7))-methyltransferase RsmG [Xanthobacteraceae bacterium]|nr:16S rRNA (guanine(527)-N(7))-methyltransferase RsmG [Xanthobacteraceae bacterium]
MRAAPDLSADRANVLKLTPVSRETGERLDRFVELLLRWQSAVQLVAKSTLPQLWTRHIADSLQLLDLAPDAKVWADLGSGGGFPGIVLAIVLKETPDAQIHLIESDQRKGAFLREAARALDLPAMIHVKRIEEVEPSALPGLQAVTARALAPLPELLQIAVPLMQSGAKGLFMKGANVENELTEATKSWKIQSSIVPSKTDAAGRIVIVERALRQN